MESGSEVGELLVILHKIIILLQVFAKLYQFIKRKRPPQAVQPVTPGKRTFFMPKII